MIPDLAVHAICANDDVGFDPLVADEAPSSLGRLKHLSHGGAKGHLDAKRLGILVKLELNAPTITVRHGIAIILCGQVLIKKYLAVFFHDRQHSRRDRGFFDVLKYVAPVLQQSRCIRSQLNDIAWQKSAQIGEFFLDYCLGLTLPFHVWGTLKHSHLCTSSCKFYGRGQTSKSGANYDGIQVFEGPGTSHVV